MGAFLGALAKSYSWSKNGIKYNDLLADWYNCLYNSDYIINTFNVIAHILAFILKLNKSQDFTLRTLSETLLQEVR